MTSLVAPYAMPSARGLVANHLRAGLSTGAAYPTAMPILAPS